jgi:hypothetical protein
MPRTLPSSSQLHRIWRSIAPRTAMRPSPRALPAARPCVGNRHPDHLRKFSVHDHLIMQLFSVGDHQVRPINRQLLACARAVRSMGVRRKRRGHRTAMCDSRCRRAVCIRCSQPRQPNIGPARRPSPGIDLRHRARRIPRVLGGPDVGPAGPLICHRAALASRRSSPRHRYRVHVWP